MPNQIPDASANTASPADQKTLQSFAPDAELANHGLYRQGGTWDYARQEFLPQLRGRQAAKTYKEMSMNDGIVGAILFAIEMVMRRVDWTVEPGDADALGANPKDVDEAAEFIEQVFDDMSHSWEDFISEVLTMLPHGWAYLEVVYKRRMGPDQTDGSKRSDFDDGKLGIRKIVLVPQDTVLDWMMDDTGGVQAAIQQVTGYRVVVPIDKSLMFRTSYLTPWGKSILRNAYIPWFYRKRIQEIEAIGIERDLVGLPVLYLSPEIIKNPARLAEYQDIIRNIRRDEQEGVILPAAYDADKNQLVKLELLSSGGSRQFDTDKVIARYTTEIAMSVLQDVILLGHEKVGTQALATVKRDLSDTALTAWLNEIAGVINRHLIPKLLRLNGMDPKFKPTMEPGEIRTADLSALAAILNQLATAGFELAGDPDVEDWVRRKFDLPERQEFLAPLPLPNPDDPSDPRLAPQKQPQNTGEPQSDAAQAATAQDGTTGIGGGKGTAAKPSAPKTLPNVSKADDGPAKKFKTVLRDSKGRYTQIIEDKIIKTILRDDNGEIVGVQEDER